MKKYWIIAILGLVLASCQESLEDRCERDAKEFTRKQCPSAIDKTTIIDSLTFDRATHTLHYYYRLTGIADEENALNKEEAINTLKQALKNSTSVKTYKDNKYKFAYTYRSEKNPKKIVLEVLFTDKDY